MNVEDQLAGSLAELGLALSESQVRALEAYAELILKWNKVYNLTAVRSSREIVTHHLLDSLAVVAPLQRCTGGQPRRLLDVGSGAGLPGVVLAICCPALTVDCVDAVGKKAAFIRQAGMQLKLPNLKGLHARVETLEGPYDVVCSRAFASLADFVSWSSNCLAPEGLWMAMKGRRPDDEISNVPSAGAEVFHVEQLRVPGLDAERCIVWMRKACATP